MPGKGSSGGSGRRYEHNIQHFEDGSSRPMSVQEYAQSVVQNAQGRQPGQLSPQVMALLTQLALGASQRGQPSANDLPGLFGGSPSPRPNIERTGNGNAAPAPGPTPADAMPFQDFLRNRRR